MELIWILTVLVTSVFLELFLAASGWLVPLYLAAVFYLFAVYSWPRVLLFAVIFGLVIDIVQGRPFFAAAFGVGLSFALARGAGRYDLAARYILLVFPGFFLGLGYAFLVLSGELLTGADFFSVLERGPWILIHAATMAAVATIVAARIFDEVAIRIELPGLIYNRNLGEIS